jgi:3-hydroxymyristoyl/3-hydroxydecanoyl-(acyl carrier protein) dehydratase
MGGENRELVQLLAVSYIVARQRSGWQRFSEISSNAISLIEVLYFAGIDAARFKRPVEPGDQLLLEVELLRMKAGIFKFKTRASVAGETAVEAELTCAMRSIAPKE